MSRTASWRPQKPGRFHRLDLGPGLVRSLGRVSTVEREFLILGPNLVEKIDGSVGTSPVISSAKGREIRGRPARLCVGDDMAVKDPICAMVIEESDAVGTSEYNGTTYYFCSMDCKEEFDENPGDYAD